MVDDEGGVLSASVPKLHPMNPTIRSLRAGRVADCLFVAVMAGLSGLAPSVHATLFMYEGFNYTAETTLVGQNGGTGWSGAWVQSGSAAAYPNAWIGTGSLGYTDGNGNTLLTSGNRGIATGDGTATGLNTGGSTGNAQPLRQFDLSVLPNNVAIGSNGVATTWISFLAARTDAPFISSNGSNYVHGRAAGVQLFNRSTAAGGGTEILTIGRASQNSETTIGDLPDDTWSLYNAGNANATKATANSFTSTSFILIRIDHDATPNASANPDTAYMWINPGLTLQPDISTAAATISANFVAPGGTIDATKDYTFDAIRLFGGSRNAQVGYGQLEVDEIRVADSFADVAPVPEPGSVALALLGGAALLTLRRRAR